MARALVASVMIAVVLGGLSTGSAEARTVFGRTDLGTLGGSSSLASKINSSGQVAGYSWVAGNESYHAFLWSAAGGMVDIGTLGGAFSQPEALSDAGEVVGWSDTSSGSRHGFSWTAQGGIVDLGTLGGSQSDATDVNRFGVVVGSALTPGDATNHAVVWRPNGEMVDLGTLPGGRWSYASAINEAGQVAGTSSTPGGPHAFSWTEAGGMIDLGDLNGVPTIAAAVSDSGQVVGYSYPPDGRFHAFSWTKTGGMVDLGTLGGNFSTPTGVNGGGQVVGYSSTTDNWPQHAFVWTEQGGLKDINGLGGEYSAAHAVNESGQVVGEGYAPAGLRAFSWTADSGMVELQTTGWISSQALDVNEAGEIAGVVYQPVDGSDSYHAVVWRPLPPDTTNPTLKLPTAISTDATSPNGALVTYEVTATDDIDPEPEVLCAPASGSEFGIGDTAVDCTATDASGNVTSGTFTVHVRSATEQLRRLADKIQALNAKQGIINSLDAKLQSVLAALGAERAHDVTAVCAQLDAFTAEVHAQAGKALPQAVADDLVSDARRIEAVVGC